MWVSFALTSWQLGAGFISAPSDFLAKTAGETGIVSWNKAKSRTGGCADSGLLIGFIRKNQKRRPCPGSATYCDENSMPDPTWSGRRTLVYSEGFHLFSL
jgi:hypothetical protein